MFTIDLNDRPLQNSKHLLSSYKKEQVHLFPVELKISNLILFFNDSYIHGQMG